MMFVVFAAEYRRRVKSKVFLIVTFLGPLLLFGGIGTLAFLAMQSAESETERLRGYRIGVLDEDGRVFAGMKAGGEETYRFVRASNTLESAKQGMFTGHYYALLVLPPGIADGETDEAPSLYVRERQSILAQQGLSSHVSQAVREVRLAPYDLSPKVRFILANQLALNVVSLSHAGEEEASSPGVSAAVGFGLASFTMFVVALYGGLIMQVMMEEKGSRMAEVVLSSVRPLELLMGKILSVAAVAATQIGTWIAILAVVGVVLSLSGRVEAELAEFMPASMLADPPSAGAAAGHGGALLLAGIRYDVVLVVLVMLPLGYFLNCSVFAAVGAMYENPTEAQMSVTLAFMPMILTIFMVQMLLVAPNSGLVAFGAFFPFSAPALLPARMLLTDMPVWQTLLSVTLCAVSTFTMLWLAARIFRGSLLIYGKRPTLRDLRNVIFAD